MPVLSPTDFEAFAAATGTQYPSTAAEKARLAPIVLQWKQDAEADRNSNIPDWAIPVGATALGLSLAGYGMFDDGQYGSEAPAAAENAAPAGTDPRVAAEQRIDPLDRNIRRRDPARSGGIYTGPRLRGREIRPPSRRPRNFPEVPTGSLMGMEDDRASGAYRARTDATAFHDPAIKGLDTPEKRTQYLIEKAEQLGPDSQEFRVLRDQVAAMEATTPSGVDPRSFISSYDATSRYGTTNAAEVAASGGHLAQSRTKSNISAQDGYSPRATKEQWQAVTWESTPSADLQLLGFDFGPGDRGAGLTNLPVNPAVAAEIRSELQKRAKGGAVSIDPSKAEVFFQDTDGSYVPWLGSRPLKDVNGDVIYTGRKADGRPVAETALEHFPLDDIEHYGMTLGRRRLARMGENRDAGALTDYAWDLVDPNPQAPKPEAHPYLSLDQIAANSLDRPDTRYSSDDDPATKGLFEPLPSGSRPTEGTLRALESAEGLTDAQKARRRMSAISDRARQADGVATGEGVTDNYVWGRVGAIDRDSEAWKAVQEAKALRQRRQAIRQEQVPDEAYAAPGAPGFGAALGNIREAALQRFVEKRMGISPADAAAEVAGQKGAPVLLDSSGFQSEGRSAGARTATAQAADELVIKYNSGRITDDQVIPYATELAKAWSADPSDVLRLARASINGESPVEPPRPAVERRAEWDNPHAVGAFGKDALDKVYSSLGMHAKADNWQLEEMVRSGDFKGAAEALAPQLPQYAQLLSSQAGRRSKDEVINLTAEAVAASLNDLNVATRKYPELLGQFGSGEGAGGFHLGAFVKSYARDYLTARGIGDSATDQPVYQVPNDALEILALDADARGRDLIREIDDKLAGAPNGLIGALRLDRMVSEVQSTKDDDPNSNATRAAQALFDLDDPELLSTQLTKGFATDVTLNFSSRTKDDLTAGFYDRNPSEPLLAERIEEYTTLADGSRVPLAPRGNRILENQAKGSDARSDAGMEKIREQVGPRKARLLELADQIELAKAQLNGARVVEGGKVISRGQNLVIATTPRGAQLDVNSGGLNRGYDEFTFSDAGSDDIEIGDRVAVDIREDWERDLRQNNQSIATTADPLDELEVKLSGSNDNITPEGVAGAKLRRVLDAYTAEGRPVRRQDVDALAQQFAAEASTGRSIALDPGAVIEAAADMASAGPSEADITARAYGLGTSKGPLKFKNLGPSVKAPDGTTIRTGTGAMAEGPARRAIKLLRDYLDDRQSDQAVSSAAADLVGRSDPGPTPMRPAAGGDLDERQAEWVFQEDGAPVTAYPPRVAKPDVRPRRFGDYTVGISTAGRGPSSGGNPYTRSDAAMFVDYDDEGPILVSGAEVEAPNPEAGARRQAYGLGALDLNAVPQRVTDTLEQAARARMQAADTPVKPPTPEAVARAGYVSDWADKNYGSKLRVGADGRLRSSRQEVPFVEPSPATLAGRIKGLRLRGII